MTRAPLSAACERAWQAAAVRDGRLTGADRASFERHVAQCASCSREKRLLARLEAEFNDQAPSPSPLELRRQRNQLLARANQLVLGSPRRMPPARSYWFALAAVCLSVATAWAVWSGGRATPQAPPAPNAVTAPTYHLSTSPRASWRLLEETSVVRIELLNGRFDCQVDKLESGQRFVLQLPDGELEVKGTRFITDVANGRTRSVSVQEGRVALRMQGQPEVFLVGGDVWPPIDAESDDRETQPPSTPTAPPKSVGAQRIASAPSAPRASTSSSAPGASPSASEPVAPSTASEFARAMSAYSAGDFARAEVLFLQFEQHHPRDGRVEDSAFLRAVARSRRGDPDGAAALAREYLRRFPRGLRRLEAERLAGTQ